jgi:hypothetical protein
MHKFKFNPKFINVLNKCIDEFGNNIVKFDTDSYYNINTIVTVIKLISKCNRIYYTLPNDLKEYFKSSSNNDINYRADYDIRVRDIKQFITNEITYNKVSNNFSDTYIMIGNNDQCNIKQFTVYI